MQPARDGLASCRGRLGPWRVDRRGGQAVQIGLGLAMAFAYLAAQKLTEPFGYSGELDPVLTAFVPHVLFFLIALLMLMRARK